MDMRAVRQSEVEQAALEYYGNAQRCAEAMTCSTHSGGLLSDAFVTVLLGC